jgi:hypothetical protein
MSDNSGHQPPYLHARWHRCFRACRKRIAKNFPDAVLIVLMVKGLEALIHAVMSVSLVLG